jgi:excinuclease UvrABC ATPase subunit
LTAWWWIWTKPHALEKNKKHTIEAVVDRFKVRPDMALRLAESFETALRLADGWRWSPSWTATATRCFFGQAHLRRTAATRCPTWSRACFPSTIRRAPARNATAWARNRIFPPTD